MNNFQSYWNRLCETTPGLRKEEASMTIKVSSFKSALLKSYQQGTKDLTALKKELDSVSKHPTGSVESILETFFGK